jgi:hypothetical protein
MAGYYPSTVITDIAERLKAILNAITRPMWINPTTGTIRQVDTVATVSTVTTAADVTRINNLGSATTNQQSALYVMMFSLERQTWALNVRGRIS